MARILYTHRLILSLIVLLFSLSFISLFPEVQERLFVVTTTLYKSMVFVFILIIPFSITEFVWISAFIFLFLTSLKLISAIQRGNKANIHLYRKRMLITLLVPLNLYMLTAGIAYQRSPIPIPLSNAILESTRFDAIISYFQQDFNQLSEHLDYDANGSVINPYDWNTLTRYIRNAAEAMDDAYFLSVPLVIKPMTFSWFYSQFHITGMHFSLTSEALVNTLVPDATIPFTMAHEVAHVYGVMREEDANLFALYLTLQSPIPYIRYSGYFASFYALMRLTRYMEDADTIAALQRGFSSAITGDYRYQGTFWGQYTLLDDVGTWINDFYLRIMGNEGVTSYVDVPITEVVIENGVEVEKIIQFSPFQRLYFSLYPNLL